MTQAEIIGIIISAALLIATAAAAVAALVQASAANGARRDAQMARDEARAARDEAAALARQANESFERQAAALERSNELVESQLPKRGIFFQPHHVAGDTYSISCDDLPAEQVSIGTTNRVQSLEDGPRDLQQGDTLRFMVMRATFGNAGAPRLVIDYVDPQTGERQSVETDLNV